MKEVLYLTHEKNGHGIHSLFDKKYTGSCPCAEGVLKIEGVEYHITTHCWRQERVCVASCQSQKVVGVQVVGVLGGTIYHYELEDGRVYPSNDKSIRIGDEACECSGYVVKLSDKENGKA